MKRIKIFFSIIVFAVCAAFNVPAQSQPVKPLILQIKAEKIERLVQKAAKSSNFHSTDSLVFYESVPQRPFFQAVRTSILTIREKFSWKIAKITKVSKFQTIFYRRVEFLYV